VTNKNYNTNRPHSMFTDAAFETAQETPSYNYFTSTTADPLAQFRDKFMDNRQRTPYHTPGGEKTSLFDSMPGLGRSASTRTPPRAPEMPGTFPGRPRSFSAARSSSNDGDSEDSTKVNTGISGATNRNNATTSQSKASDRYKPTTASTDNIPPRPANTTQGKLADTTLESQYHTN
jgi:hypothetical protein